MNGSDLREYRRRLKLDRLQLARLIGYTGSDRNNILRVRKMENGSDVVPLYIARLLWLAECWARRFHGWPEWPEWEGYDFKSVPDPDHQQEVVDGAHG